MRVEDVAVPTYLVIVASVTYLYHFFRKATYLYLSRCV